MKNMVELQAIAGTLQGDRLRFLTAERRRAYTTLLWLLLARRRAHQIEILYDDLLAEALALVPGVEPGAYDPDAFRADINQLGDWGNLATRLEPRRIETLADRSLRKYLCRLDDETVPVLEFLESRVAGRGVFSDHGRHLLRDAADRLADALRLSRTIARAKPDAPSRNDDLLRFCYLSREVDRKVDEAARELAAFDAALVAFSISPFRLESLAEVIDRLERYVEDYVAEATERARVLHHAARALLRRSVEPVMAEAERALEKRIEEDIFGGGRRAGYRTTRAIIESVHAFFAPGRQFETLLERVHGAARDVVRRVHSHIESVRARNIRIETLRDRTREMTRLGSADLADANRWINALFASAHLVSDLRKGTPLERAQPPRPARRYESQRISYAGGYLTAKTGSPGQARALQRALWLKLGRFVDERILRDQPQAPLRSADLNDFPDFRLLLDAVKAYNLRTGRNRRFLSYKVEPPRANGSQGPRARFEVPGGTLDAPDLMFSRQAPNW